MHYKTIETKLQTGILLIRINRPEVKNALSVQFIKEFDSLFEEIKSKKEVRVIIITGNEEAFAAGGDIREMIQMSESQALEVSRMVHEAFSKISTIDIPVIAAVQGLAMGGGCELVMWCDFCIASEKAIFALPENLLGIIPGGGGTQLLSRIAGQNNALFYLMTGEQFTSERAMQIGIVQKICSHESVLDETFAIAEKLSSRPFPSLKELKKTVREGLKVNIQTALKMEAEAFGRLVGNEGKTGLKAFLEKKTR